MAYDPKKTLDVNIMDNFEAAIANPSMVFKAADLATLTPSARSVIPKITVPATAEMVGDEVEAMIRFWRNQLVINFQQRSVNLLATKWANFVAFCYSAKVSLANGKLGTTDGGLRLSMIKPETIYANGASTATKTWLNSNVTVGWNAPFWTINLNQTGKTSILNTLASVEMLVMALGEQASSPKLEGYQWKETTSAKEGYQEIPWWTILGNLGIYSLPEDRYVRKNTIQYVDVKFSQAGVSIPTAIGPQIQTDAYAVLETE